MEKLNIKILKLFILVMAVAFSSSASAGTFRMTSKQPVYTPPQPTWYLFGYGGYSGGADYDTNGELLNPEFQEGPIPISFDSDGGWSIGGGSGVYSSFLGGSRFEIEGSYLDNEIGSIRQRGVNIPSSFNVDTAVLMFNLLKEVPISERMTGYFGGGIGYGWTSVSGDIDTFGFDDSDGGFAWQLIAGVDFWIAENLALFLQYRYLNLSGFEIRDQLNQFDLASADDAWNHSVLLGLRVAF